MFRYYPHGYVNGNWLLDKRKIGEYIEKNAARQQKQVESFHKREDAGLPLSQFPACIMKKFIPNSIYILDNVFCISKDMREILNRHVFGSSYPVLCISLMIIV